MALLAESVILGLLTGCVYALMASGLTLIFGVMEIINIAQGIFVVLGAYLSYTLEHYLSIDPFLGLLITMPMMFLMGLFIEWAFIRRIRQNRVVLSLLVTYAVGLVIEGLLNFIYTATTVRVLPPYVDASFPVFGFYISYISLFSAILSVVVLAALYIVIYRTRFGYSMRATMQNRTAAMLIGIDVERVSAVTFGLGVALTAAGGMSFGAENAFNAASSYDLISRLLVIIVLGGMGSLRGALLASLFMLVVGAITDVVWSPVWSSTVFFGLLILLLLFRPQGLFGKVEGRKQ